MMVKPKVSGFDISAEQLIQGLEYMMRLRIFDDRMMKMQRAESCLFTCAHLAKVAIAETIALEDNDWIFPLTVNLVPNSLEVETWLA